MTRRTALVALAFTLGLVGGVALARTDGRFTDVPAGHYTEEAIAWAVAEGITSGCTTAEFCPDEPPTRAQAVTFLHRALVGDAPAPVTSRY